MNRVISVVTTSGKIRYESGLRMAIIRKGSYFTADKWVVDFYWNGYVDFEWKRGANGVACDICDTLESAKRKARYYVSKE